MHFVALTLCRMALAAGLAFAGLIAAVPAQASMKCEEVAPLRYCGDAAPRPVQTIAGTVYIPAPIIPGYPSACWAWHKTFQCIETEPIYTCDSGRSLDDVRAGCSLTAASIDATLKVNAVTYITSATYTYRCAWGDWTEQAQLPQDKECVLLDTEIKDTNIVASAPTDAAPSTGAGKPPTTAPLSSTTSVDQGRDQSYACYSKPVTTCSDTCYETTTDPVTGSPVRHEVACTSPVTNCVSSSNQCSSSLAGAANDGTVGGAAQAGVSGSLAVGPDGRCVNSTEQFVCESGPIPKCLTNEQCTLQSTAPGSVQDNGVPLTQEQTYVCTNETKSCGEISNANNCVSVNAWGWDKLQTKSSVAPGLGEANAALSKLDAIQKGMNQDDPYIFSGQDLRCHYPIGNFLNTAIMVALVVVTMIATNGASSGMLSTALTQGAGAAFGSGLISQTTLYAISMNATAIGASVSIGGALVSDVPNSAAFGTNCCKDYVIEGSDAWYKFGACSADEVKLAVARRKGLSQYIGEYCSKRSGFPIRQCVEKTRTFCAFDDMLALVVNKQGRAQLDQLAAADPATAIVTPEQHFAQYAPAPQIPTPPDPPAPSEHDWDNESGTTSSPTAARPAIYSGVLDNGSWKPLINQNGSQVWYWQYPTYCASAEAQKAAHDTFDAEVAWAADMAGVQPGKMTQAQAYQQIAKIVSIHPFQECAGSPGALTFMTCDDANNACDTSKLPEGPSGIMTDMYGADVSSADMRWSLQQVRTDYTLGQYGITTAMQTDPSYAAVGDSLSELVSSVGSCQAGDCLYRFVVTDRAASGGLGANKRVTDYARFPLYTAIPTVAYPAIDYVSVDGVLDAAAYAADPNKGMGNAIAVNKQSFIFRPYLQSVAPKDTNIHSKVLLEWAAHANNGAGPWVPVLVPTNLPPSTDGFYPYVASPGAGKDDRFYLSGGCDRNSRWCNYQIEVELNVPRHPWGEPKAPRCWGFTIEQMAALDFDRMDLSEWINSLDLGATTEGGLSEQAAKSMAGQVAASASTFYGAYASGDTTPSLVPGVRALVTNTSTLPMLSAASFSAYTLQLGVTSNWPQYNSTGANDNPVTNVAIDWGDGTASAGVMDAGGRAWRQDHDYGSAPVGRYTITVSFDTANNGHQVLTTQVEITPNAGDARSPAQDLEFGNQGPIGNAAADSSPSTSIDGTNTAPANIGQLAPGQQELFGQQGSDITPPAGTTLTQPGQ